MTEKEFNVTATIQIFQHINAETEEEAIIQMREYLDDESDMGPFFPDINGKGGIEKFNHPSEFITNIKCEEREGEK